MYNARECYRKSFVIILSCCIKNFYEMLTNCFYPQKKTLGSVVFCNGGSGFPKHRTFFGPYRHFIETCWETSSFVSGIFKGKLWYITCNSVFGLWDDVSIIVHVCEWRDRFGNRSYRTEHINQIYVISGYFPVPPRFRLSEIVSLFYHVLWYLRTFT